MISQLHVCVCICVCSSGPRLRYSASTTADGSDLSLVDCLDYTFGKPETLTGSEAYSCDVCKKRTDATQESKIGVLPAQVSSLIHVLRASHRLAI